MIEIVRADSLLAGRRFYSFSHELYRDEANWAEPKVWGGRRVLDAGRNELMRTPHVLLMAMENGKPLARVLTGCAGGEGYFSMFDAHPCGEAVKRMMDEAAAWQRSMGSRSLFGPIAPTPVDLGGGILCEGFGEAAAYGDAYNAPYYGRLLEECGFAAAEEWLSYRAEADRFDRERYKKAAVRIGERFGLSVRRDLTQSPRELAAAVGSVMGNEGEMMNRLIGRMEKELADGLCPVVCADGNPVGFLLTIIGRRGRIPRIVTMWVHEKWRRKGVTALIFDAFMDETEKRGITCADASLVNEDNEASRKSVEAAGGREIRRYRQYKRMI